MGKTLKNFIDETVVSAPRRVSKVFETMPFDKMRFQVRKYEKYFKFKNNVKRPLDPCNKELCA